MKKKKVSLSICVTAYNEEKCLAITVTKTVEFLEKFKVNYEIIIINDGSIDNTQIIAGKLASKNKKIKLINNKINIGVGNTIKKTIKICTKEWFAYIPGDNQFRIHDILNYLKYVDKYDLIIGYIKNKKDRQFIRRFFAEIFIFVIRLLFNINVKYTNGFSLIKHRLIKNMKLESTGHSITSEIIIKILKFRKVKYTCLPFTFLKNMEEKTTAFNLSSIINAAYYTFRLWYNIYILRKQY